MTNLEKYTKIFTDLFAISEEEAQELEYQAINDWDSVGHMTLISMLEDAFDIMLETDDIIDFSSFKKGIEIINKYGVEL